MKRNTMERREKIKDLILEKGLWSLNKKKLARDFKVSYPTIYNDIKAILKKIPDDKIEEIGYELNQSFKEALSIARRLLKRKDDLLKLRAIDVLTKVIDRYTGFLEAFGRKPVTPDKLDINQGVGVSKYNELVDEFNFLLDEYKELYEGIEERLKSDIIEVNRKFMDFKLEKIMLSFVMLNEGFAAALNHMVEEEKITGEVANECFHDFEDEVYSFFTEHLNSKGCKRWLSEPITLYDNLEDAEKIPKKENISSIQTHN